MRSAPSAEHRDELLRRFVEAARRAQIVTIVNLARSELELGELFTAELCEAFEAEIALVLATRDGGAATLVGAHGLTAEQRAGLLGDGRVERVLTSADTRLHDSDLLGIETRELVLVPFMGEVAGMVGVARLYDERFDEGEVALLEAVGESLQHALERIRLGEERDALLVREHAARREAEATTDRLVRLKRVTETILASLPVETMLRELLERLREVVMVDVTAIFLDDGAEATPVVRAAAGTAEHVDAAVAVVQRKGLSGRVGAERRAVEVGERDATIRSLIGVPLVVEGKIIGLLVAGALSERTFSPVDKSLLGLAADRAAIAIENARLYREAEERGQAAQVLGYVADGVFLVDADGAVQLWNPAAEAITGVRAAAVLGRPLEEAIPGWEALAQAVTVASAPAASAGRPATIPVEIEGRELWLSVAGVGFADGTVYAFRDLTEERRLEELKSDFVATVSHELRTPIAAVHGAAKTLEREDVELTDDVRGRILSVISEQSERLVQLVNDILLTSQVESGALVLVNEQVDVSEVARGVIEAARMHAPKALSLELSASATLQPVATDPDKLRQVLANLVGNPVKYSFGSGRVDLRLEPRGKNVCIEVRDRGVGIPKSEQERIFEKFYRHYPGVARGVGGTGLGLYICRELVRRMGGRIWVESREGGGSTFFVELPLAAA